MLKLSRMSEFKAIAFDLDGTLVEKESSWLTIHEYFNTLDENQTNIKKNLKGRKSMLLRNKLNLKEVLLLKLYQLQSLYLL